jgi:ATP-dependent Lon protease
MAQQMSLSHIHLDLPMLPLKDMVVYPHMVVPLFVGRPTSVKALEEAMMHGQNIFVVAQKEVTDAKDLDISNLYRIGTVATVLQMLRLPDGTLKILVEGQSRARAVEFEKTGEDFYHVNLELIEDIPLGADDIDPLCRTLVGQFDQYVKVNKKVPPEVMTALAGVEEPGRVADTIAAHLNLKINSRQQILEARNVGQRVALLLKIMETEIDVLHVEKRIRSNVKDAMDTTHRQYYLNEQLKAIKKEMGKLDDKKATAEMAAEDVDGDLGARIKAAKMPKEALKRVKSELKKLSKMPPMSSEATVSRHYIDTLIGVPWHKRTRTTKKLAKAQEVLDEDHYGLDKIKERILEHLAVQHRVGKIRGPILCLVGPPGVGKTSLGQSIARAVGRKFTRFALGGVRDEAEIRGHRRTYVGALPGKIIHNLSKVGVKNPLFLLDEIDKMATDFRGDPSSALLEVLDPEQNHTFVDHYLEVDYDLSDVMFVATANSMNIPPALLDRMEVIRLSGYTEDEKCNIATKYLLPKHLKQCGLKKGELNISDDVLLDIVRSYTREAGVRNVERELAKLCRKVVKSLMLDDQKASRTITLENLEDYLGVRRFSFGLADEKDQVGQVTGLAWTEVGGELLKIEVATMSGKGKTHRTGKLGDVMLESISAATTVVRARARAYGIADDFYEKHDVHVHVPEGATPKDGPSAGAAICTAIVSALSGIPVRKDIAMTGEITLRGEVLPIGGLKEKLLAALRGGIKTVLIPQENEKDLKEISEDVKEKLSIVPVKWIDQVLDKALTENPQPIETQEKTRVSASMVPVYDGL